MSYTFGSSDASDFEIPDEDHYIFQVTKLNPPELRPNKFFEQFCTKYFEDNGVEYDRESDPKKKKIESNVVAECSIFKSVSGDEEWSGTMVKYYSGSKPGNEMGSIEFPTKLRKLANAVLGRTLQNGETVDQTDIENGYFTGAYVHKTKQDGGLRGQIESPLPYKAQGTGQGGRRRQAAAPPPPVEEFDPGEFEEELTA